MDSFFSKEYFKKLLTGKHLILILLLKARGDISLIPFCGGGVGRSYLGSNTLRLFNKRLSTIKILQNVNTKSSSVKETGKIGTEAFKKLLKIKNNNNLLINLSL